MASYNKPTNKQLAATMPLISSPQHEAYFFSRLENPLWIAPLAEHYVFKYPPKAEPMNGGGIRHPLWPPSQYLARMATQSPAEVAKIFAGLNTDNASIIGDMLHAALAMPANVAVSLVPAISEAVKDKTQLVDFSNASDLCARLAEGDEVDVAMELADALFTPTREEDQKGPGRRDECWYEEGLKKVMPLLVKTRARTFLPRLCDWLKAMVKAMKHVDADSENDMSYVWRPAIEEHEQNNDYDFAGVLVGCARAGFEEEV